MSQFSNAFIFHGTAGHSQENWFPWLKKRLEAAGTPTTVPDFPTPEGESLKAWFEVLEHQESSFGPDTLLVGHSKGGLLVLELLQRLKTPIAKAVFVGTPVGLKPITSSPFSEADASFSDFRFDWKKIRSNVKSAAAFHSDNDPFVNIANAEKIATELKIDLNLIRNAGHFNETAGYTTFEALLPELDL